MTNGKQSSKKLILTGLIMGLLLSSLDQTITTTAMPTVVKELGGLSLYSWVFSIYMLTSTTSMPIYGKLADLYGRKRMYPIGMVLFLIGSALCGLATDMTQLILFRGIQGLGAGALMPIAMTIAADLYPPEKRGGFQALFGAVLGLASMIGPAIGGYITEHVSWQWAFYINLPFGIAAIWFLSVGLKEKRRQEKHSIDWMGAITLSGAIISILLALVLGGEGQPDTTRTVSLLAIGALLSGLFLWIEKRAKEPILPLSLFRNRVISVSSTITFLMGAGMFGAITYIPLFVQGVIGVSPSIAGYILTPFMLAFVAGNMAGGRLITLFSYRAIVLPSLTVMATGFWLLAQMDAQTTNATIIAYMILAGLGMGPLMPVLGTAMQNAVDSRQRGVVTSFSGFVRLMGGTIGVSIMGALMAKRLSASQIVSDPQAIMASSIQAVFYVSFFFIVIGWCASFFFGKARLIKQGKAPDEGDARDAVFDT